MNVAPWTDTPFDDEDAFADFTFVLNLNHRKIAQVMFENLLVYDTYPLADGKLGDKDWLQNLQQELQSIFAKLELTGLPDFSSVDLRKEDEFEDFMLQLEQVESNINHTLGIL